MNQSNKRRVFLKKFFWCGIAAVFVILAVEGTRRLFFCPKLRFPACVMLTDFQSPDDTITGDVTQAFKNVILDQLVDDSEMLSMLDDARTIKYSYSAVEVTERQFPEFKSLNRIVEDCTRIMGIDRPRVFVEFSRDMNAFSLNPTEPIIILSSELVRYCTEDELRFVIGRECGHIKCNHVQMMTVLFAAKSVLSEGMLSTGLLLPYLNLCREAEYSADNAGLICCQNLEAAEQIIVRSVCGLGARHVGKINIDEFLAQTDEYDFSKPASVVQRGRELLSPRPFAPMRIKSLRRYAEDHRYRQVLDRAD